MRLIDADAIPYFGEVWGRHDRVTFKGRIDALPTVDAVEVVRCGECKQFHKDKGLFDAPTGFCFEHGMTVLGVDYCSYGVRKEK